MNLKFWQRKKDIKPRVPMRGGRVSEGRISMADPRTPRIDPVAERLQRVKSQSNRPKLPNIFARFRRASAPNVPNAAKLRTQREAVQRDRKLKEILAGLFARVKVFVVAGVLIVVILIGGLVMALLHEQGVYIVEEIEVAGNVQTSKLAVISILEKYRGRSMLTFFSGEIEGALKEAFPYIRNVFVKKELPGRLDVVIEERFPVMSYVNLAGVYLIDEDSVVVTILVDNEVTPLTSNEQIVFEGFGNPDADYVFEKYLSKIDDEVERAAVKWEEIPGDVKLAVLEELRTDIGIRVNKLRDDNTAVLAASEFVQLPKVFALDAGRWEVGGRLPEERYLYSKSVIDYFVDNKLPLTKVEWQSEFALIAELADGVRVIFSTIKDIVPQLETLAVVRTQVNLTGVTVIDLRGELVAVK